MHGEQHALIAVAADRAGIIEGARLCECEVEGCVRQASDLGGIGEAAVWLRHLNDIVLATGIVEDLCRQRVRIVARLKIC